MTLEILSLLSTFENSSNCIITSFDSDSFPDRRIAKGLFAYCVFSLEKKNS